MRREHPADPGVQNGELLVEGGKHSHEREGDLPPCLALGTGQARGR